MTDYTLNEICSQPEVWQQTLDLCERLEHKQVTEWIHDREPVLTGSGSSYYLALTAAAFFTQLTRRRAAAVSASEVCTFPDAIFPKSGKGSLLAISRKGKSAETVVAARWFKEVRAAKTAAVSTVTESPLLEICEPGLLLTPAAEQSRYMTRSFTAPLLAIQYLVAASTGHDEMVRELRKLPEAGRQVIDRCHGTTKSMAEEKQFGDYVGLGQGSSYGLAAESMLKVKEMVRAPAEAYPSLEVMHGPNYLLSQQTLVTLILSESAKGYELALLERLRASGAYKFVICDKASEEIKAKADCIFELGSGLSELARLVLAMPVMQLFAYHRARATGNLLE
jgi:glutamine---fructose-6-phosphate transaminase (isomerizing)